MTSAISDTKTYDRTREKHSWRLHTSWSMKREALRTESDTSHSVMSFGFSRWRRRKRTSIGTPPYCRLWRMVRRESRRPFSSWRWRSASASLILRASRATTAFICATSSGDRAKSGLSDSTSRVRRSPCR